MVHLLESTTVSVAPAAPWRVGESTAPRMRADPDLSLDGRATHRRCGRPSIIGAMETRWRRLIDAGIAVSSELSLDGVLQRIVETAAELTAARYAALGVIDPSGRRSSGS